jgi:hypothetical protein
VGWLQPELQASSGAALNAPAAAAAAVVTLCKATVAASS